MDYNANKAISALKRTAAFVTYVNPFYEQSGHSNVSAVQNMTGNQELCGKKN